MPRLAPRSETVAGNGLRQLLDLEAELERRLAQARSDADGIRAKAEQEALASRRAGEAAIRAEEDRLLKQHTERHAREAEAIRAGALQRSAALRAIPAERIDAIARELLTLVSASPGNPGT